jgi:hypothetical protein
MALTPVDMIIKELCRATGEPEYRNYDEFVGHIRRGFSQINIAAVQIVKYSYIPLNAYNAINWPCDCIKPVMVGMKRNGVIVSLSVDDSLIPSGSYSTVSSISEAESQIDLICSGGYKPDYCFDINGNGELYGLGPGYNAAGYVTHDKHGRQSHIKGTYLEDDEFLFVYLSDGISDGIEFVPVETEIVLRAFALSEYYRTRNPNLSRSEREIYKEELTFLRNLYQSANAEDWTEAFRHNEKSSPK